MFKKSVDLSDKPDKSNAAGEGGGSGTATSAVLLPKYIGRGINPLEEE